MIPVNWNNLNKLERAKLVRFYIIDKRWSYGQLAQHLGVTRNTIAGICNRNDIKIPKDRLPPDPVFTLGTDNVVLFPLISRPSREEAVKDMVKKSAAKLKAKRIAGMQTNAAHRLNDRQSDLESIYVRDPKPLQSDVWKPLPGAIPVLLEDTNIKHCRWPVSDDNKTCCGGIAREGKPYCEHHCAVAYRPAKPITLGKKKTRAA